MADVAVEIGGIATSITTRDEAIVELIRDRYKGFIAERRVDWRLEMGVGTVPASEPDVVVQRTAGDDCFSVRRHDFVGTLDLGRRTGWVTLLEADDIALDSFFRVAYSLVLLERGGLVLHSAALVRGGRARVFCGPSGSGKTTIARLSDDARLLSDELSIVRVTNGSVVAHGTPFWGDLARAGDNVCVPVAGVYLLHHGPHHVVQPLPAARALAGLLPNVLCFAKDAALGRRVLAIAGGLVESVPCATLTFRRDPGFWELLHA